MSQPFLLLWKFIIRGDEPIFIDGIQYADYLCVVAAPDVDGARTIAKAHFTEQGRPSEWIDHVKPIVLDTSVPGVLAAAGG